MLFDAPGRSAGAKRLIPSLLITQSRRMSRRNPRLQKELVSFKKNAPAGIRASACEDNILRWHYVVEGPKDSPYEGGFYHGEIKFPAQYPFKPPSIWMVTPSGRFQPNVRICMSFTDYHPEEWNPAWSASTILTGLLSFMVENESTAGSIVRPDAVRRRLARSSLRWNVKNNPAFCKHFPELVELAAQRREEGGGGGDEVSDDGLDDDAEALGTMQRRLGRGWELKALILAIVVMAVWSMFFSEDDTGTPSVLE